MIAGASGDPQLMCSPVARDLDIRPGYDLNLNNFAEIEGAF
jgi:hypothetical protein